MTIGEKITAIRKEKNMTQEDLANKLNVSRQTISKWENDTSLPDVYNLQELSKILNVSVDELLDKTQKEIKSDNDILEAVQYGTKFFKKHWMKYGYKLIIEGVILSLFGLIFIKVGKMMTNPFDGFVMNPITNDMNDVINIISYAPTTIGIILIIIGSTLVITDRIKNRKKEK